MQTPPQTATFDLTARLARRAREGEPMSRAALAAGVEYYLAGGLPAPEAFPLDDLSGATARMLPDQGRLALQYSNTFGQERFLTLLAERLTREEGVPVAVENLLLTSGSIQGLWTIAFTLLDPGDTVIVEGPTYMGALGIARRHEANIVAVPVDEQGLRVDQLADLLDDLRARGVRPKFLYTIPTFQNPTGAVLSLERRQALVALARERELILVEDDAYSALRYDGEPLPSLYALDGGASGLVLKTGTISKTLAAGLRLGWILGAPPVVNRLALMKLDGGSTPYVSHLVAQYLEEGRLDPHVGELIDLYRRKRDAICAALEAHMPPGVTWQRPPGGFFVWLTLPPGVDSRKLTAAAAAESVAVFPGTASFADGRGAEHLRLAFSYPPLDRFDEGIRRLGRLIREQTP